MCTHGLSNRALQDLWQVWPLPGPWRLSPMASGTNNLLWRVDAPPGEAYLLKIYHDAEWTRLAHEFAVTRALQQVRLPYRIPCPVLTRAGEASTPIPTGPGTALATLWPLIPGDPPTRSNLTQAHAAGRVLAELHAVLRDLSLPPSDAPSTYGDLAHCHPRVPDPLASLRSLAGGRVAEERAEELVRCVRALIERVPHLYGTLSQHLIHGDFAPSNLLMRDDQVSGVLDWEFCTVDLRAMDLVVLCSWWPVEVWGSGREWPMIKAIGRGYASGGALTPEEIAALPDLFLLRAVAALVHRIGRWLSGLETAQAIGQRVADTLWWAEWLGVHGEQLRHCIGQAF